MTNSAHIAIIIIYLGGQPMEAFDQYSLKNKGPISELFLNKGIENFAQAISYIHKLPYRRNSALGQYLLVLNEACGTCSTKHALIKKLADEVGVPMTLKLGMLLMTKNIMPKIEVVLNEYGLDGVPEAHVYLQYDKQRIDITFPEEITYPEKTDFMLEKDILPEDIGQTKVDFHREFVKQWMIDNHITLTPEKLWQCREKCIDALSQN